MPNGFSKNKFAIFAALFVTIVLPLACLHIGMDSSQLLTLSSPSEALFDATTEDGRRIYYYNSEKKDKLVLNATIWANAKQKGNDSMEFSWAAGDGQEKDIAEFTNTNGDKLAEKNGNGLVIDISAIDILDDYTVYARCGQACDSYSFSIESKEKIVNNMSLYYVPEQGYAYSSEDRITDRVKREFEVSSSATYMLCLNDNVMLGKLRFSNKSPDTLILSDTGESSFTETVLKDNKAYMTVYGDSNAQGQIEVSAGSKIKENFYITIDASHNIITSMETPIINAIPIPDGYRLLFSSNDKEVIKNYNLIMKIDDNDWQTISEKEFADGIPSAFAYNVTAPGQHNVQAYFKRSSKRSETTARTFTIAEDCILGTYGDSELKDDRNATQSAITTSNWNAIQTIRNVGITIPPLDQKKGTNPFDIEQSFNPYENARLEFKVTTNTTEFFYEDYDVHNGNTFTFPIKSNADYDKVRISARLCNLYGMAAGNERSVTFDVNRQGASCTFCYLQDSDNSTETAKYAVNVNGPIASGSTLYCLVSHDSGLSFKNAYSANIDADNRQFKIPAELSKNSSSVVLKAIIAANSYQPYESSYASTLALESAGSATIDSGDSIQLYPNIRQVCIKTPQIGMYDLYYLISDSNIVNYNDINTYLPLSQSQDKITLNVIKTTGNCSEDVTQLEKFLWIKAVPRYNSSLYPSIKMFTIHLNAAANPLQNTSDGCLWFNKGAGTGICLYLTSPMDEAEIIHSSKTENVQQSGTLHFSSKGDSQMVVYDIDQYLAGYRHNRFYTTAFTRKAGYMDSKIDLFTGYERSGCDEGFAWWHNEGESERDKLKGKWRCEYAL